jgi:hypothetical protein
MQLLRIVLISMCMIVLVFISSVYANHQGFDCSVCHDQQTTRNLNNIREVIETPNSGPMEVWFIAYEGWRSFADGDSVYDGVCEVCHTVTSYHTNYGDGTVHFDGQDCTVCHPHENDFHPTFTGGVSHQTHFNDPKGPQLGTDTCFTVCHLSSFDFRIFKDNQPIETTNVCDDCHSPDGAFDGVDDPVIGAKPNWDNGIYEPAVPPEPWPSRLKAGKENWCAGCHDDGASIVNGVLAPNVMGDNISYGYIISGHGKYPVQCYDCHDLTVLHTDGDARTYSASNNNYREGYRLNDDMTVPRNGEYGPIAFKLCMNCHVYSYIFGPNSNFRYDKPYDGQNYLNLHENHLQQSFATAICWDSDWNENLNNCSQGECADSAISCNACHNVHGSPTPAMIRHGELISTPGTTDKVPALDFHWYQSDGVTQTIIIEESRYGGLLCGNPPYNVSFNHVCWGCHAPGEQRWYRIPGGIPIVECNLVPDATEIPRGGILGFTMTIKNNTSESQTFLAATKVTKPDENPYPPSGYLLGPVSVTLDGNASKSPYRSHTIPLGAPLGIYTYHGYVGRYGVGIYDECTFEFEVVKQQQ